MRLISTVVASLTLHAFLLLIPVGTPSLSTKFPPSSSLQAARLLITLQSASVASNNGLSDAPEFPKEIAEFTITETSSGEEAKKNQRSTTGENHDGAGIEQIADAPPRYYSRHELDRPPRMADDISEKGGALDLALSEFAEHGYVVLELWISNKGAVEKSEIIKTDLSETVVNTVKNNFDLARFIPARLNKQDVHSRVIIEFLVKEKPGQ